MKPHATIADHLAAGHKVRIEPTMLGPALSDRLGDWEAVLFFVAVWRTPTGRLRYQAGTDGVTGESLEEVEDEIAKVVDRCGGDSCLLTERQVSAIRESQRTGRRKVAEAALSETTR